jgi:hypothetical protein
MFTAACTPLILHSGIAGCSQGLQPERGPVGIKAMRFDHLENWTYVAA